MSSDPAIERAVDTLRRGGLVAFPTETVYGLGADALNESAVARLFAVKGRPRTHPLIVHLGSGDWLDGWARVVPPAARRLAEAFWPGPLTMILQRSRRVPDAVTGGQDTVGLRVPGHPLALDLLRRFGGGIAAPSANRFGAVSPTTAAHVRLDLGDDVDVIVDGGPCDVGIESTIVDLSNGAPAILRPGYVTAAQIEAVVGVPVQRIRREAPRVPGSLESHYAPRTPLEVLTRGALAMRLAESAEPVAGLAVMSFELPDADRRRVRLFIEPSRDPARYAHEFYAALRELDAAGAKRILIEWPPAGPAWEGVRDRLRRAAGPGTAEPERDDREDLGP